MKFRFPGTDINVRLFEPVATTDTQYDIVDCGVEYKHGGIDSLVVGGSFYTAKQAINKANAKVDAKTEETTTTTQDTAPAAA